MVVPYFQSIEKKKNTYYVDQWYPFRFEGQTRYSSFIFQQLRQNPIQFIIEGIDFPAEWDREIYEKKK